MGKRSEFKRIEKDFYPTIDDRAILALKPHIKTLFTYAEPCCGERHLIDLFAKHIPEIRCVWSSDINLGKDALSLTKDDLSFASSIITNPVWSRPLLHQMIMHFKDLKPTWLLFDADWAHTKQALPYLKYCTDIVSVGRLIWIEGTTMTGKDNCAWYRFDKYETETINFHPQYFKLIKNEIEKLK